MEDIRKLEAEGVNQIWRDAKLRGAGMKRAKTLVSAAEHNVGSKEAPEAAWMECLNICWYQMLNPAMTEAGKYGGCIGKTSTARCRYRGHTDRSVRTETKNESVVGRNRLNRER